MQQEMGDKTEKKKSVSHLMESTSYFNCMQNGASTQHTRVLKRSMAASHRAGEFGRDLLRLVGHPELRHLDALIVGLQRAVQHPDEGGLAGAVLSQHDYDLAVGELPLLDSQGEAALGLSHQWVGVAAELLGVCLQLRCLLCHLSTCRPYFRCTQLPSVHATPFLKDIIVLVIT